MGFQASATSVTIRARLTKLGREEILKKNNSIFSHFILGDSDANYYTSEPLPTGTVPVNSGNLAFITGSSSDNINEINNHHLKGPFTTNKDNINRKAIDAPI